MLEELTEFKSFGTAAHIRLIFADLLKGSISIDDLNTLVSSKGSVDIPRVKAVVELLLELRLCYVLPDSTVALTSDGVKFVAAAADVAYALGLFLFSRMVEEGILLKSSVFFDVSSGRYYIKQTAIKTRYAAFRNLLVVLGALEVNGNLFMLCPEAKDVIKETEPYWRHGMTPKQLAVELNKDREAGERAERYVMDYERRRLGSAMAGAIEQVSLTSVSAGFDIASFETSASSHFDRFIEVKAYGRDGFYFSSGELETARQYGKRYLIYVVELGKIVQKDYTPLMIRDPANYLKSCVDWRITPDRLKITRLCAFD